MKKEEILKNLVVYFTYKVPRLSKTKLVKLIYLADRLHYEKTKQTISDLDYINYYYGPWSPEIEKAVEEQCGEAIEIEFVTTAKGDVANIHKPKKTEIKVRFPDKSISKTLDEIIKKWGNSSLADILKFVKTSTPFIESNYMDPIDFMLLDPELRKSIDIASEEAQSGRIVQKSVDEL